MKLNKYLVMCLLAAAVGTNFSACSDDANDGDAPRLFRPVSTVTVKNNSLVVTWDAIKGATNYDLELFRVTGTDENDESIYESVRKESVAQPPYTFEDLNWDEKYMVAIKCNNDDKESGIYLSNDVSVTYISKISDSKTIDNAARISWKAGGSVIKAIKAVPTVVTEDPVAPEEPATRAEETTEGVVLKKVSTAEYEQGYADVLGLKPETEYTFLMYSDAENMNNDTYAGKAKEKTKASDDFDTTYGAGNWLDIRSWEPEEAKDTLKTAEFWDLVKDGMTVILRGEQDYKVGGEIKFDRSVTFTTGQTLGANARFISGGGMTCAKGASVDYVKFVNIDIYSDKALPGGGYEVDLTDNKGFGGRQVFNENGTSSTLNSLSFIGCHIEGYRAVIRLQSDKDKVLDVLFEDCTINGIGDQGFITTNNKKAELNSVTVKNSTLTNMVMFCDFRSSLNPIDVNIENCTFCYAPIECAANANLPLFRTLKNQVNFVISKTLFGPSMATKDSAGAELMTNQAGPAGSIMINGTAASVAATSSFKTNFAYTAVGENTYPLEGLLEFAGDETELWNVPAEGDFKIVGTLPESGIGASKWW